MSHCPVCESRLFTQVDFIEQVPVFLNRRWSTKAAAIAADVGTLSIQECSTCGFVWNDAFNSGRAVYDRFYENDQTYSATFQRHLGEMADRVIAAGAGQAFHVLEIGCGQGVFLKELVARAGSLLLSATGYDPAYRGLAGFQGNNIRILREYFNRDTSRLLTDQPNIIVARHTIEHVPEPVDFLSNIRNAIDSNAMILLETPDVDWILTRGEVQDLFYEHCSLFNANSLGLSMVRAGWRPLSIDRVFGAQYLCALGKASEPDAAAIDLRHESQSHHRLDRNEFVSRWRSIIQGAAHPVALWGAGAKGVTFAILTDPRGELIKTVVDINPEKQGCFLPKSGIPIVSPKRAAELGIQTVLAMNPNYVAEITAELASNGSRANVIAVAGGDRR